MLSFWTILSATAPVFLVISVGFFLHRRRWIAEETEFGVMRLALNLLIPCLILTVIPGNSALTEVSSALWAIGAGFTFVFLGFLLSLACGWLIRLRRGEGLRTFAIGAGIQNYGYLPIPIIAELFSENSGPMGLVFIHGLGVELALWSVGLAILTGRAGWRPLVNGPFLSVLAALVLNYTGAYQWIPAPVASAMKMLGGCAVPLSILMIGATMGRFFRRDVLQDAWRVCLGSVFVRMVLLSAIMLTAVHLLPLHPDLKRLMVIQAAMPAAVFPIFLARIYGGSPAVAIQVVLATSLVSVVSTPLVIAFGLNTIAR